MHLEGGREAERGAEPAPLFRTGAARNPPRRTSPLPIDVGGGDLHRRRSRRQLARRLGATPSCCEGLLSTIRTLRPRAPPPAAPGHAAHAGERASDHSLPPRGHLLCSLSRPHTFRTDPGNPTP